MKCPNCNKEIRDNSKFCSQCGCSVNEEKYIYKETNKKTAFTELLSNIKMEQMKMFRKNLIGNGNFSNGCFIKYMDFDVDKNEVIKKIVVKKTSKSGIETRQDYGFVLNNDGTMKIINFIQNDSGFKISSLFDDFLFNDNKKRNFG